ncbi:hypothetical protein [Solobacterium moorei]|uniref:hypothetical protein n=1 Tax=Solobacterium moorei TaxID=102148 RepID=UPI00055DF764|nr:hypothetical protein [Solobacterium moorei]BET22515.1 hypothetical protein RGT18_21030 [Solobacterium moorei]
MNKYQEALLNIRYYYAQSHQYKKLQKYNAIRQLETLQELVDRATPKKPINQSTPVVRQGYCPNCKGELQKLGSRNEVVIEGQLYCCSCGQALDWSEE